MFKVARGLAPSPPDIQPYGCNCPDFELRNQPCKHVIAVQQTGKQREWIKLHAMTGVRTNVVTAVEISGWRSHDTNYFRPLVATTAANFSLREVSADKAYLSKANVQAVDDVGGTPFIPIKGSAVGKLATRTPHSRRRPLILRSSRTICAC